MGSLFLKYWFQTHKGICKRYVLTFWQPHSQVHCGTCRLSKSTPFSTSGKKTSTKTPTASRETSRITSRTAAQGPLTQGHISSIGRLCFIKSIISSFAFCNEEAMTQSESPPGRLQHRSAKAWAQMLIIIFEIRGFLFLIATYWGDLGWGAIICPEQWIYLRLPRGVKFLLFCQYLCFW